MLRAGQLQQVVLVGPQGNAGIGSRLDECLCIGMPVRTKPAGVLDATRKAVTLWAS
jgi:hypothetical protein